MPSAQPLCSQVLRVLQPGVLRHDGPAAAALIAIAPHGQHRRRVFEPVEHLQTMHITGVQDEVDAGKDVSDLAGQFRHGFRNVRIRNQTNCCHPLFLMSETSSPKRAALRQRLRRAGA